MAKMNKILLRATIKAEAKVDSAVPLSDRLAKLVAKSGNASLKLDEMDVLLEFVEHEMWQDAMAWVCAA